MPLINLQFDLKKISSNLSDDIHLIVIITEQRSNFTEPQSKLQKLDFCMTNTSVFMYVQYHAFEDLSIMLYRVKIVPIENRSYGLIVVSEKLKF